MEISAFAPFGAHANIMAQLPARKPPDPTRVESPPDAGKARAEMHNSNSEHGDAGQLKHNGGSASDLDAKDLTGPPPSFDLNVLEMDRKLQQQLARIETERATADSTGLKPAGQTEVQAADEPWNSDEPQVVDNTRDMRETKDELIA